MRIHIVTLNVEGEQVGAWATVHAPKAEALAEKLEAHYGDADDHFVGCMWPKSRWKQTSMTDP